MYANLIRFAARTGRGPAPTSAISLPGTHRCRNRGSTKRSPPPMRSSAAVRLPLSRRPLPAAVDQRRRYGTATGSRTTAPATSAMQPPDRGSAGQHRTGRDGRGRGRAGWRRDSRRPGDRSRWLPRCPSESPPGWLRQSRCRCCRAFGDERDPGRTGSVQRYFARTAPIVYFRPEPECGMRSKVETSPKS